jgi:excisionase family DNA binding protein
MASNVQTAFAPEPLAYRIDDAGRVLGIGRTSLYKLIAERQLRAVKIAGRTVIPAEAIRELLNAAPSTRNTTTLARTVSRRRS